MCSLNCCWAQKGGLHGYILFYLRLIYVVIVGSGSMWLLAFLYYIICWCKQRTFLPTTMLWKLLKNILFLQENTKFGPVLLRVVACLVVKLTILCCYVYRLLSFHKRILPTGVSEMGLYRGEETVKVVVVTEFWVWWNMKREVCKIN